MLKFKFPYPPRKSLLRRINNYIVYVSRLEKTILDADLELPERPRKEAP